MYVCVCVCVCIYIYIYTHKWVGWKPKPNTLEADGWQHDCPATCVFAQYSSATFVSLHFQSCKKKFGTCFKNVFISIFFFYIEDCVSLKLHNLNLCIVRSFCTALMNVRNKLNEYDADLYSTHRTKNLNFYSFNQLHMWLELLFKFCHAFKVASKPCHLFVWILNFIVCNMYIFTNLFHILLHCWSYFTQYLNIILLSL